MEELVGKRHPHAGNDYLLLHHHLLGTHGLNDNSKCFREILTFTVVRGKVAGVGSSELNIVEVLCPLAGLPPWRKPGRNRGLPALMGSIWLQLKLIPGAVRNLLQGKGKGKAIWAACHVGLRGSARLVATAKVPFAVHIHGFYLPEERDV